MEGFSSLILWIYIKNITLHVAKVLYRASRAEKRTI